MSLDYPVHSETKINESFLTAQFNDEGYKNRAGRDWDKYGGGLIELVRRGLIFKRLRDYKPKHSKFLCFEFDFTNKNWICFSM